MCFRIGSAEQQWKQCTLQIKPSYFVLCRGHSGRMRPIIMGTQTPLLHRRLSVRPRRLSVKAWRSRRLPPLSDSSVLGLLGRGRAHRAGRTLSRLRLNEVRCQAGERLLLLELRVLYYLLRGFVAKIRLPLDERGTIVLVSGAVSNN